MFSRLLATLLVVGGIGYGIYYLYDQRRAAGPEVVVAERAPIGDAAVDLADINPSAPASSEASPSLAAGATLANDADELTASAGDAAGNTVASLADTASNTAQATTETVAALGDTAADMATSAVSVTDAVTETIVETANTATTAAADATLAATSEAMASAAQSASSTTEAAGNAVSAVGDTLQATGETAIDLASNATNNASEAVTAATDTGSTWVSTVVADIPETTAMSTETVQAEILTAEIITRSVRDSAEEVVAAIDPTLLPRPRPVDSAAQAPVSAPAPIPVPASFTETVVTMPAINASGSAAALEQLSYGMTFADARDFLLSNGWQPRSLRRSARPDEVAGIEAQLIDAGFDELVNCDEAERALCRFEFVDGNDKIAAVLTRGRDAQPIVVDSFRMTLETQ